MMRTETLEQKEARNVPSTFCPPVFELIKPQWIVTPCLYFWTCFWFHRSGQIRVNVVGLVTSVRPDGCSYYRARKYRPPHADLLRSVGDRCDDHTQVISFCFTDVRQGPHHQPAEFNSFVKTQFSLSQFHFKPLGLTWITYKDPVRTAVCTGFWLGNLRERDHWGDPDVDGRIILRWIFRKWEGEVWGLDEVGSG